MAPATTSKARPPPTTPRRGRRKAKDQSETKDIEDDDSPVARSNAPRTPDSATAAPDLLRASFSPRELRQRRREQLRSKATGMISATSPAKNKKVIFGESDADADAAVAQAQARPKRSEEVQPSALPPPADAAEAPSAPADIGGNKDVEQEDDDDDDGVEEMTSKAARQEDLERRELERQTARAASLGATKKSRKRKDSKAEQREPEPQKDSNEELSDPEDAVEGMDMDESFFAQLDAARESERRERRRRRLVDSAEPRGKHTTFVVEGESAAEGLHQQPVAKKADHNVQVVVKPAGPARDEDVVPASSPPVFTLEPVSTTALVCSRGLLLDGSDIMSAKAQQKAKKNGVAHQYKDNVVPGWTRSKKMSFLASNKGRRKKGAAAPLFVVKK